MTTSKDMPKEENNNKNLKIKKINTPKKGNNKVKEVNLYYGEENNPSRKKKVFPKKSTPNSIRWKRSKIGRDEDIENSLSEIYKDKDGNKIDVDKLRIRKKRGFIFWLFNFLLIGLVITVAVLGTYYYVFYSTGTDSTAIELTIEANELVLSNEEFFYTIKYKNLSYVPLNNVRIDIEYPDNFIFLDSSIKTDEENYSWNIGKLKSRARGELKIKGKIVGKPKDSSILLVKITYIPENFSSEFEKEASFNVSIKDIGFNANFDYSSSVLVDEEASILITLQADEDNFLNNFLLRIEVDENIEIIETIVNDDTKTEKKEGENELFLTVEKLEKGLWYIDGISKEKEVLEIKYKVKEKIKDIQKIKFYFEKKFSGKDKIAFFEDEIELEVMKSDLNLSLIINGSQNDSSINFENQLNYSLVYSNKGEAAMKNVSIMIVLESDFLDWTTLKDENNAKERGNTLTWTKEEIDELGRLEIDDEGVIDFSINILPFKESELGKDFRVISYAQYNIGSLEVLGDIETPTTTQGDINKENLDNRSNVIVSTINSDLKFKEEVRYFDENNMPVGIGPLPPQVSKKTSFKVFWTLNNNLHELSDVVVESILPNGVTWDERNRTSVGNISYDPSNKKITWQIGRLPITVPRADAEFGISITPKESDLNKILVLSAGSVVSATDADTNDIIEKTSLPKTSKLEDDDIASLSNDGLVRTKKD